MVFSIYLGVCCIRVGLVRFRRKGSTVCLDIYLLRFPVLLGRRENLSDVVRSIAKRHCFNDEFDLVRIGCAKWNRGEGFPPVLGRIARLWPTGCATVGPTTVD